MNKKIPLSLVLLLVLLPGLLLSGCGQVAGVRATPTSTAVPATVTPQSTASETPLPSATASSTPTETATSRPTRTPAPTRDRTATAAAMETAAVELINAILSPDLEAYGVDPSQGELVWLQSQAIQMDLTSYMENKDRFIDDVGSLTDFVVQTRITWHTSGALSLCGITFHADEDREKGAQNRFFLMRLQFDPSWTVWRWQNGQFQDFVSGGWWSSRHIHDKNGSTNLVALVVRGKNIEVFINRDKQRTVEDARQTAGLLAFSANQESGKTMCRFEKSWVWAFK